VEFFGFHFLSLCGHNLSLFSVSVEICGSLDRTVSGSGFTA